jgi:putative sterol carrier protein
MSAVADFFAALPARAAAEPEKTRGLHDTYLFQIGEAGSWTVAVEDGTVTVTPGDGGAAACTIATDEDTFLGIVGGTQSPMAAFMRGKVKIAGDMGVALRLKSVI